MKKPQNYRMKSWFSNSCCVIAGILVVSIASWPAYAADGDTDQAVVQPYAHYTQTGNYGRNQVIDLAKKLAKKPYKAPSAPLPEKLDKMSLDNYQSILFQPTQAIWNKANLPFKMQLKIRGSYFKTPVEIATVDGSKSQHIPFAPKYFTDSSGSTLPLPKQDIGFSGLSLYYRLNHPETYNKVLQFQGASYFKAIGKNENWGSFARGLAINTADPKGEEIPVFRAFWVEKPSPNSNSIVVNALLDSPSVTGAYRFTIRPGVESIVDVEASLFPRHDLKKVGLAPMNSMYLFSSNTRRNFDDYRPEVHNADGLLMVNGKGERLWRPLNNPKTLQMSSFVDEAPIGFGLMQRDRKFSDYQDLKANFQDRPSLWVEPIGNWGKGSVTLIEIPSHRQIHDNIVAFWKPKNGLKKGREYDFSYRLHWGEQPHPSTGKTYTIHETFSGKASPSDDDSEKRHFVVDYKAPQGKIDPNASLPHANVKASAGKISDVQVVRNPHNPGYRVSFNFEPKDDAKASELRAELTFGDGRQAETWLDRWTSD